MNGEKDSLLQQQQEKLNKTEQELETLLGRLGNELGLQVKQGETGGEKALTNDDYEAIIAQEDGNPLLNNEENILKLLKSLDNAGKIMDLIDVRGERFWTDGSIDVNN